MKKTVRIYLSSYVDVEFDSEDFSSNSALKHYVCEYWTDYVTKDEAWNNIELSYDEPDVFDEDGNYSC